jgi:molecular chaperone DnaK (HSP70)
VTIRYCIGIDLGTTNSVVAYVDTFTAQGGGDVSRVLPIEQKTGSDLHQRLPLLRSALFFENDDWSVGEFAYSQQQYTPDRVVVSSKSWLCHGGVNREAAILPWGSTEIPSGKLLSPVDAARRIVRQIKEAWNAEFPAYLFQHQHVIITVPASFDADAQDLTLRAAKAEGIENLRLLEEPQAALYRWLERSSSELMSGSILVCDVGGGTTDLSLFEVSLEESGLPKISRVAVSDHILLGGDNIDAAIAERLAVLFEGRSQRAPSTSEKIVLRAIARRLKEQVLGETDDVPAIVHVSVPMAGRSLFGGAVSLEVDSAEIRSAILDGFFPYCERTTEPQTSKVGLRDVGLPYARDPRVTAHLAAFVREREVDAVIFNGGTLASPLTRERLLDCLTRWQGSPVNELRNTELDTAVARGAAWFGYLLQRNRRELILGGYPRSLYLELFREKRSDEPRLLCVVPKGFSEPEPVCVKAGGLTALVDRPVRFQLWSALDRPSDKMGDVVALSDGTFKSLAPLATQLTVPGSKARGQQELRIPIELFASLSETGLCKLECRVAAPADPSLHGNSWELRFNVRGETPASEAEPSSIPPALIQRCIEEIDLHYGRRKSEEVSRSPKGILKALENLARKNRDEWDISFMRALWPPLGRGLTRRGRSLEHEVAWLGVAGFILRPGFGYPLDDVRIAEAWKIAESGLAFPRENASKAASLIFWRRIAGGLTTEQHGVLFEKFINDLKQAPPYTGELVRLLASLERVDDDRKRQLLESVISKLSAGKIESSAGIWSIQRLLTREPALGSLDTVVPGRLVSEWLPLLERIPQAKLQKNDWIKVLATLAQRTDDPRRDVPEESRRAIIKRLRVLGAGQPDLDRVEQASQLSAREVGQLLGDNLPSGIQLAGAR